MKSHVSDQIELMCCIIRDAHIGCAANSSALRDLVTMRSRTEQEGLSFLTITLPSFGKDFEKALDQGFVDSTLFRSFKKSGAIPAFLQGMLSQVFDQETGRRFEDAVRQVNPQAVASIRQCAYAFKKLEKDCTRKRVQSALDRFESVEHELEEIRLRDCDVNDFVSVASHIWGCLCSFDATLVVPRHGPGATAEHIAGNRKYVWQYWYERLELYFPFFHHAYSIGAYGEKEFEDVTFVSEEQELPVRVTPVPKTLKGPRIIAIEPTCMQYAQQAIREYLYDTIESSYYAKGHVNFTDQSCNRDLAMSASKDGLMATLDLSDASDRVYHDLAMRMFDGVPDLRDAIEACRSTRAILPDGTLVGPLKKFASMGSALCFPVESMYFYTICVVALLKEQNLLVTPKNIFSVSRDVYVYGDDIIVPRIHAAAIVGYLQKYYCKVNVSKSFWTGRFRESCGMDAYAGVDVTPVYVHTDRPTSRRQARNVISWICSMNAFYKKGFMETSSHIQKICERHLGPLPTVTEESSVLGRIHDAPLTIGRFAPIQTDTFMSANGECKLSGSLHRSEVRGWCASPVRSTDELDGYGALQKSLLTLTRRNGHPDHEASEEQRYSLKALAKGFDQNPQAVAEDHLQRSVRRGAVTLKHRWCAAR